MPEESQPSVEPVKTEKQTEKTWPRPTPPSQDPPVAVAEIAHNSPGALILQWLTYAFWGWTVLALAWLTAVTVDFFLNQPPTEGYESTTVAYPLAAVVVLFIISLVCDFYYSRVEPLRKAGAAMVIMIIHAVIFALFGIGSLIVAVFAIVRLLIGDGDGTAYGDSGALTMLVTGGVIAVVYGATLLRTLRPFKLAQSARLYWLFMAVVTVAITALGIAGPTWNARMTRDDRLIERGLPLISDVIHSHTADAGSLPMTLADIRDETTGDARTLIDRNLVEYTPGDKVELNASDLPLGADGRPLEMPGPGDIAYKYTLCVVYKMRKDNGGVYPAYEQIGNTSPDTYRHDAGRVCYDLQTGYYGGKYF